MVAVDTTDLLKIQLTLFYLLDLGGALFFGRNDKKNQEYVFWDLASLSGFAAGKANTSSGSFGSSSEVFTLSNCALWLCSRLVYR